MSVTDLQAVANTVVRRAERQGFVRASDIRRELAHTSLPEKEWKKVVALSRTALRYRQGRYYFKPVVSPSMRQEHRRQRAIHQAVRQLARQYRKNHSQIERRKEGRIDFVQPVRVCIDGERELTLLSRDLSLTGIRLIGTTSLLGQRVEVVVAGVEGAEPARFLVRILWTYAVGDGLFENGGKFLELVAKQPEPSSNGNG